MQLICRLLILMFYILSLFSYASDANARYRTYYHHSKPSIFATIDRYGYIQSLVDDIQINADGSADVSETIILQNADNFQRSAFIRFFPYSFDFNLLIRPKYLINQISVDNNIIPNRNANVSVYQNHYAVLINQNTFGLIVYNIHYHDYFGIQLKKDEDQFIWQLDNTNLDMPIHYVEYNITFPPDVQLLSYRTLLGTFQENDTSYVMQNTLRNNQEIVRFYTTRSIQTPEKFSILISLKKGIFTSVFTMDNIVKYFSPSIYLAYFISILFFFYILHYFSRLNIPSFYPNTAIYTCSAPENLTPSEIAYMANTFDTKLILIYITNLLLKGYFILDLNLKKYIYQEKPLDALPNSEKMISNRLIRNYGKELYSGFNLVFLSDLKKNINKYYINTNIWRYSLIITLCVFALIDYSGQILLFPKYQDYGFFDLSFLFNIIGFYLGLFILFVAFSNFFIIIKSSKKNEILIRIILFLIGIGIITYNFITLLYYFPFSYYLPLLILAYPNFLCIRYSKAFNANGIVIYQQILGFKDYLLNNEFELSSYEFEKYLPYAIGLNIQNAWAEKFKSIYPNGYKPQWIIPTLETGSTLPELIKSYMDFMRKDSFFYELLSSNQRKNKSFKKNLD